MVKNPSGPYYKQILRGHEQKEFISINSIKATANDIPEGQIADSPRQEWPRKRQNTLYPENSLDEIPVFMNVLKEI